MFRRLTFTALSFIMTLFRSYGQEIITGQIKDAASRQSLQAASVTLMDMDNKVIKGTATDTSGTFHISNMQPGNYKITVSSLGYLPKTIQPVAIKTGTKNNLGIILLSRNAKTMTAVQIQANRNLVESKVDRFVYYADKDVTNQSGTGIDVMRKIPVLSVDLQDNVSIYGTNGIRVLINGKPSSVTAFSIADALRAIPASEIKAVEIFTTPSAKYDAEGTGGMINIITKRKNKEGLNGNINLSAGNRTSTSTAGLNYKTGKVIINGTLNGGYNRTILYANSERTNQEGAIAYLKQRTDVHNKGFNAGGQLGIEYSPDSSNILNATFRRNARWYKGENNVLTSGAYRGELMGDSGRYAHGDDETFGYDLVMDYTRHFKKTGQDLLASVQYSYGDRLKDIQLWQGPLLTSPVYRETNYNNNHNKELTIQADYVHPFKKGRLLELGVKSILRDLNSDFGADVMNSNNGKYAPDPWRTGNFYYDQDVYAAYATYSTSVLKKYLLKAGLRLEDTRLSGKFQPGDTSFDRNYLNLVPTINIARRLKKPGTMLKLSYSRRIQRPGIAFLNPYINQLDIKNITVGNPALKPELTDVLELGYNTYVKKWILGASGYARFTHDVIERVISIDQAGISYTTYRNISNNTTVGANVYGIYYISAKWSVTSAMTAYHYDINSSGMGYTNAGWVYSTSLSSSLSFGKGWAASGVGLYNSSRLNLQGKTSGWGMISLGLNKEVLHKKGKIGFTTNNPLWSEININQRIAGPAFEEIVRSGAKFQSFNINFNYLFGKEKKNTIRKQLIQNNDLKEEDNNTGIPK
jgi:outer membrane receptor protein involved in Fe transport